MDIKEKAKGKDRGNKTVSLNVKKKIKAHLSLYHRTVKRHMIEILGVVDRPF